MFDSPGLRLAIAGGVLVLLAALAMLFLPRAIAVVGLLAGGSAIMSGFVWTLLEYYTGSS